MESKTHRIKLKYGDFEFELEGDREFVESKSNDISSFLALLTQKHSAADPSTVAIKSDNQLHSQVITNNDESLKSISISEFLNNKNFNNETDLVLGIGYFLENNCQYEQFTSSDIKEYCRKARCSVPRNVSDCLLRNTKKGLSMPLPEKANNLLAYQLTNTGLKYIKEYVPTEVKTKPKKSSSTKKNKDSSNLQVSNISVDDLKLTKYVDVYKLSRIEEQALLVLKILSSECSLDNLTVDDIFFVLKDKLGIPVNREQVRKTLERAKPKVDISKLNGKNVFKLMKPGHDFVQELVQKYQETQ